MKITLKIGLMLGVSIIVGGMTLSQSSPLVLTQPITKNDWSTNAYHLAFEKLSDGGMIQYGSSDIAMYGDALGDIDGVLIKRALNGSPVWGIRFASAGMDAVGDCKSLPDGSLVCLVHTDGNILGNTSGTESTFLVKISSLGTQLWATKIPLGAIYIEGVDDQGFLLMNAGDGSTQATYVNTSGSVLWSYTWTTEAVSYLGRHGAHSRFYVTYDSTCSICCIDNGQLCSDTVTPVYSDIGKSMVTLNGTEYMIREEKYSGNIYLSLVSLSTGQSTHLVNLPNKSSYYIRTISNGGDRSWLLVERDDFSWSTEPDMIESPGNTRSAAVYEVTVNSATKKFDVFQQYDFDISASYRRSDGSFMFVVCFNEGGYGGQLDLGTNIKTFSSNGILINDVKLNEYTHDAVFNATGNMLYGRIYYGTPASPYDTNWALKSYYATLPTVAAPTFNLAPGTYTGTQSVSISCATTGATIRYTTDGSEPTEASTQYTVPISVNTNTTVKARAFKTATITSLRSDAVYTIRKTISGTLTLGNYTGSINGLTASILLRRTDGTPLQTSSATLNSAGAYSFLTEYEGSMEMLVTIPRWLKKKSSLSVTGNTTCNLSLTNGDADGGNSVNLFDYVVLDNAYGTVPGDPSWNFMADLDGGLSVNSFDYTIIDMHFGAAGDN